MTTQTDWEKAKPWFIRGAIAFAAIVTIIIVLHKLGVIPGEYERCVKRGVAYFREIGSYPRLSTGADAEVEAADRCRRTTTAFP